MRLFAYATMGGLLLGSAFPPAASPQSQTDLPGVTSNKDFHNGAELQPADVQFYLRIARMTVDRLKHPSAQDLSDIAETQRLRQIMAAAQTKVDADRLAGKSSQTISADQFRPTPDQRAIMNRGNALLLGNVSEMLAANEGMPGYQWYTLSMTVEEAAGLGGRFGSGEAGSRTLTPEQQQRAAKIIQVRADNRKTVAPDAPEINKLVEQASQLKTPKT